MQHAGYSKDKKYQMSDSCHVNVEPNPSSNRMSRIKPQKT